VALATPDWRLCRTVIFIVEESIREQAQEIAKSNPYREILFHGSESGLKGNISLANRICRDYRREGKYFDEIIDSARQK